MSTTDSNETLNLDNSSVRNIGRVKWFNNKQGYGFITVTDGQQSGKDIFVHHSGVIVSSEQYKYLVQGEYVEFNLDKSDSGSYEFQAGNVSGINGGKLMCETRRDFRQVRNDTSNQERKQSQKEQNDSDVKPPQSVRPPLSESNENNSEWTYQRRPSQRGGRGRGGEYLTTSGRGRGRPAKMQTQSNDV